MKRLREVYDGLGALLAYLKNEKGQTLIEYILIIVVILNSTIETTLSNLNQKLNAP
jgi:Flp pilus assembly pilin Flp